MRVTFVVLLLLLGAFVSGGRSGMAQSAPAGGLPVTVSPSEELSGRTCTVGQPVDFHVVGDVKDAAGVVVAPDGSRVQGYVVEARKEGGFGRAGVLRIACAFVVLKDGTHLPLRFDLATEGISDRLSAEIVALPVANIATVAATVGGLVLAYGNGATGAVYLILVPAYVAVKVYHFIGNLFHGTDAVTRPGDLYLGEITAMPRPVAVSAH